MRARNAAEIRCPNCDFIAHYSKFISREKVGSWMPFDCPQCGEEEVAQFDVDENKLLDGDGLPFDED